MTVAHTQHFIAWFDGLPEGRQAVLRQDKWMLAQAAFDAGAETQQARITALETELAQERIAAETAALQVFELGKRVAELDAENITLYGCIYEASLDSTTAHLRCKIELQRIARKDAKEKA